MSPILCPLVKNIILIYLRSNPKPSSISVPLWLELTQAVATTGPSGNLHACRRQNDRNSFFGSVHPFLLSLFLLFILPPIGLDTHVTAGDVMADLRRRRLIPKSSRVQHYLHFPSCPYRRGPLELHERLVDFSVRDHSTLLLKGKCVLGGASDSSSKCR